MRIKIELERLQRLYLILGQMRYLENIESVRRQILDQQLRIISLI